MPKGIRDLIVFMASPGDLIEERDLIRRLADEVNAIFEDTGAGVRVVGWETTQPEFGRAQDLINPRVHDCDVFIGILKRRWGTPTGEHSSGFEEEFKITVDRRKASPKPAISLYFARVPAEDRGDPGPHLAQVLAFRERIQMEQIVLFREFRNPDDLVHQIQGLLTSKLLEMIEGSSEAQSVLGSAREPTRPAATADTAAAAAPAVSGAASARLPTMALDAARQQLSTALQRLDAIVRDDTDDHDFDRDRISLMAVAFGQDDDRLGTHLVNRLYTRRNELILSAAEAETWTRTLFNDLGTHFMPADRTIPGCGALAALDPDSEVFDYEILKWAADKDESVARGAMRSLARLGRRPSALWGNAPTDPPTAPGNATKAEVTWIDVPVKVWVKLLNALPQLSPAFDYLLHGYTGDRDLLSAIVADKSLNDDSRELIVAVLAGLDGDFSLLAGKSPSASDRDGAGISEMLIQNVDALGADDLNRLARDTDNTTLRLAVIRAGLERRALTNETLLRLLKAEDRHVNDLLVDAASSDPMFALNLLALTGNEALTLVETPDLKPRLMAKGYTVDELRASHDSNRYSSEAWEALTYVLGDDMVDEAREILDTKWSGL